MNYSILVELDGHQQNEKRERRKKSLSKVFELKEEIRNGKGCEKWDKRQEKKAENFSFGDKLAGRITGGAPSEKLFGMCICI